MHGQPTAPGLRIETVDSVAGFRALQGDWDTLFARAARPHNVFQSHVFLRHWVEHYAPAARLAIIAGWRDDRLVMAWPLQRARFLGLDVLRVMGAPVAQFDDILVDGGEGDGDRLVAAGWRALAGLRADLAELRRVRRDGWLAGAEMQPGARTVTSAAAPFAALSGRVGPDGPGPNYASRDRSNYRRRLRRLEEDGAVSVTSIGAGTQAREHALAGIAMKRDVLEQRGTVAPTLCDPRFAAFFGSLAGDAQGGSPVAITALSRDGRPIGVDLALDCKGTSFGHVLAVHPDHQRGGVGGLVIHHSFASALARGNAQFDLLSPADSYKLDHADGETPVRDVTIPLSLRGRLACALGLSHWRPAARAALGRIPAPLRQKLVALRA